MERVRVVTYNVHRCKGVDARVRPGRIVEVLREIGAECSPSAAAGRVVYL